MSHVAIEHQLCSPGHQGGGGRGIPRASTVVHALSHPSASAEQHPLLAAAAKLATEQHIRARARHLIRNPDIDDHGTAAAARTLAARETTRAGLIERIDHWAASEFGHSRAPVLHTETLGQLIDRLATIWARCYPLAEDHTDTGAPARLRAGLHQLGELCTAYDDLVTDLERGRRRLPLSQTPTGPDTGA